MQYHYQDLIAIFAQTFSEQYNTRLIKGGDERFDLLLTVHNFTHQAEQLSFGVVLSDLLIVVVLRRDRQLIGYLVKPAHEVMIRSDFSG